MLNIVKSDKYTKEYVGDLLAVYEKAIKLLDSNTNNTDINLYFVGEKKIREINKSTRNIDKVTDVLSFPYTNLKPNEKLNLNDYRFELEENEKLLFGEIFICTKRAKEQAINYGHSFKREICFLLTHGILHLHGYDHIEKQDEKVMFELQDKILSSLKIER